MILRFHRQNFKPVYLASLDIAKAFDTVSHKTINDILLTKGLPTPLVDYIMATYEASTTKLTCDGWESDEIHPTRGVKQDDPLSPLIFNMVIDELLKLLPSDVGVDIDGVHYNALAYADDMILVASTPIGLQLLINKVTDYLALCGLNINTTKSFTVSLKNVPHVKKSVVDAKVTFDCLQRKLPALRREDEWRYLGVQFTPEGCPKSEDISVLKLSLNKLSKAPLKPQQRLLALRVMVLPGLYHLMTLGNVSLCKLKKVDSLVRGAVKKWLGLPHDTVNAYVHAKGKDGGLSIPSMRWLMPLRRKDRLEKLARGRQLSSSSYLSQEIAKAKRRLNESPQEIRNTADLEQRWARLLHSSWDGMALKDSRKVPQQHHWVTDGSRLVTGRDFVNMIRLRINALPSRSRMARGRISDRSCRAGCNETETLNHILQVCYRTHAARIERHNAIASYIKRAALDRKYERVDEEPRFITSEGLRKPDLIAKRGEMAIVIDAQVVSEQTDLKLAHKKKVEYYEQLKDAIVARYTVKDVAFTTATLSCRGIWSSHSANQLVGFGILRKKELKILSTRTLIGGLAAFWKFNKLTTMFRRRPREGIG